MITKAIDLFGLKELASRLGVTYQAIRKWERSRVPDDRVKQIIIATDGAVTAHDLRPDLYPEGFEFPPEMLEAEKARLAGTVTA